MSGAPLSRRVGTGRRWRLYRSVAMRHLGQEGLEAWIRHRGLLTWVDLRTVEERARDPSWTRFVGKVGLQVVHRPLRAILPAASCPYPQASDYVSYLASILDDLDAFVGALEAVVDGLAEGVVVGCSQGKDRTGLVCAALLELDGASWEEVAEDYARALEALAEGAIAEERSWNSRGLTRSQYLRRYKLGSAPLSGLLARLAPGSPSLTGWLMTDERYTSRIQGLGRRVQELSRA